MNEITIQIAAVSLLLIGITVVIYGYKRMSKEKLRLKPFAERYKPVKELNEKCAGLKTNYENLRRNYKHDLEKLKFCEQKTTLFDLSAGTVDSTAFQMFTSSVSLEELEKTLLKIQAGLKSAVACVCQLGDDMTINGKKSEARKFKNREVRLRTRCIDNEFKMSNSIADWNNINRLIERSLVVFSDVNATGSVTKTVLKRSYIDQKINELKLKYEIKCLKESIKEEEREKRRIESETKREEARLQAAVKKVQKDREIMEKLVAREIEKLDSASEEDLKLIETHRQRLKELRDKETKALSMAQLTKVGYVYIITNESSFGAGICKIGMTRRLDPYDRVNELSDASVPESFDAHSFIYCEDAPALEKVLHEKYQDKRVNLVNRRKEFFQVEPATVVDFIKKNYSDAEFTNLTN